MILIFFFFLIYLVIGDILVCTGKAKLLIRERFNQFNKLINDCETKKSEKEVKLDDLQGFWEVKLFFFFLRSKID